MPQNLPRHVNILQSSITTDAANPMGRGSSPSPFNVSSAVGAPRHHSLFPSLGSPWPAPRAGMPQFQAAIGMEDHFRRGSDSILVPILRADGVPGVGGNGWTADIRLGDGHWLPEDDPAHGSTVTVEVKAGCRDCYYDVLVTLVRDGKPIDTRLAPATRFAPPSIDVPLDPIGLLKGSGLKAGDLILITFRAWCLTGGAGCSFTRHSWIYLGPSTRELEEMPPGGTFPGGDFQKSTCACEISELQVASSAGDMEAKLTALTPDDCQICSVSAFATLVRNGAAVLTSRLAATSLDSTPPRKSSIPNVQGMLGGKPGDKIVLTAVLTCIDREGRPCMTDVTRVVPIP